MAEKKRPTVYFSNKLEQLAESLGEELWQTGGDPFAKRTVILPHHGLKSYLSAFFARHPNWSISAGVEYKVLVEGAKGLLPTSEEKFPTEMALSFAIEKEIETILSEESSSEFFSDIKRYVDSNENGEKVRWIACELAHLFYEYGVFESKALVHFLTQKGWKQEIWKRVFSKFSGWTSLSQVLCLKKGGQDLIHLFGFSHVPSHFYDFFCSFSVKFYFLSPSEMFWEDLCSDRERIYLEKKMEKGRVRLQVQEQLRFFLTKTHPLLANWGRVGRPLLARFGQMECYLEEQYQKDFAEGVLGHVQNSLLELEDESEEKQEISLDDVSILCISAPSKLREVEILLQTVQELMQESDIEPKDVLVLTSDLKAYLPYIHMVFGSQKSPFSYSVHGLFSGKDPSQGITSFLPMVEARFDLESVFTFFSIPSVMSKWDFTEHDLACLRKWFEKVHVLWGLSLEHKNRCFQKTSPNGSSLLDQGEGGTWEEGIKKLLTGLAIEDKPASFSIEWTQAELLGRFIHAMDKIKEDLRPIYEEEKQTLSGWVSFLRRWSTTYLTPSRTEEALLEDLEALKEELHEMADFLLPFNSFLRAIENHFRQKKESFQSSSLQAVKFIALEMGSASPSKVIYVLGCDEESFPRPQKVFCLEETTKYKETPSLSDQGRYIFLELLLHARASLIFSYPRISSRDQKGQGPCRMVEEMFVYLDARFCFLDKELKPSEVFRRNHPSLSFAKEYFQSNSRCKSFSPFSFLLAKSYYLESKTSLPHFFPSWQGKIEQDEKNRHPDSIEISKLQDFAKNPVRFYFKEKLGIFFDFSIKQDKEFFLSPIMQKKITKRALSNSLEEAASIAKKLGELPLGKLGKIAENDLMEETRKWKKSLQSFGLSEQDLFSLELIDGVRNGEKKPGRMIMPPLVIDVEGVGPIAICGHLPHSSSKGFLWLGKKKKEEYAILWPSFLIFLCVAETLGWEKECLFVQEGKKLSICPEDPRKALSKYLKLYLRSLQEPCPIYPKLSAALLGANEEEWQKKMTPSSYDTGFSDPYELWIEKRDPVPSSSHVKKEWQEQWEEVFSILLQESGEEHADV
ncbi:MAG: exodeoxyribonuclease V subunit gamma [Chlamydiota bacterium]